MSNPQLLEYYNSIKYFTYLDKPYSINREYLRNEISWLYDYMDKYDHYQTYGIVVNDTINQKIVQEKYENFLIYMKQLPRINLKIMEYESNQYEDIDEIEKMIDIFLKNMEIIFNKKIYDLEEQSTNLQEQTPNWLDYYKVIEFIFHSVITHLDEIEFDLYYKPDCSV
jgi:hypothetical protein